MNKKREENRQRGKHLMAGVHDYGKGHDGTRSSGSPRHTEMRGPGPADGAGEVVSGGPGTAARNYGGTPADQGGREAASGAAPTDLETEIEE